MPAKTEPNSGFFYGWDPGESGWDVGMNANILKLGRVGFHLSIIDRDTADPSLLTSVDGDRYIVAASGVGDWAGKDGQVAIWINDSSSWAFAAPAHGWLAYIEDEAVLSVYKTGTGWSAGVAI